MTGSLFQLTGEPPAKVLARQRMTHADSAAGKGYEVTVSLRKTVTDLFDICFNTSKK